jgi:hypothetical protein
MRARPRERFPLSIRHPRRHLAGDFRGNVRQLGVRPCEHALARSFADSCARRIARGNHFALRAPSFARVRAMVDQQFGRWTAAVIDNHCTHVGPDYWDVWETAFHANLTLYESGSQQVVWGIALRSEVTRDLWPGLLHSGRVAVLRSPVSDRDWQREAEKLGLPKLRQIGETVGCGYSR